MATFKFELVSPTRLLFSGEVDSVVVPGAEGEFMVLPEHAPVVSTLRPGILTIQIGADVKRLFVRGGFAEVSEKGLTVLAEDATPVEEVNAGEFAASISAYETKLAQAPSEEARFKMADTLFHLKAVQAQLGGGAPTAH
jgi:F-type H+-transporting ATPase subunit epsilon